MFEDGKLTSTHRAILDLQYEELGGSSIENRVPSGYFLILTEEI